MNVNIISRSISTKVWDRAEIELAIPGSADKLATNCTTEPSGLEIRKWMNEAWPRGYKTFLCSTQLSMKFQLLIKTKI